MVFERVCRFGSGVGERHAEAEEEAAAEFIVVAVVAADDLRAHVGGELAGIEAQAFAERSDVADIHFRDIEVAGLQCRAIAKHPVGRSNPRHGRAGNHIEPEPELIGFVDGALDDDLRHVELRLFVSVVEDAFLIDAKDGIVGVVKVGKRGETVDCDAAPEADVLIGFCWTRCETYGNLIRRRRL